jgi:predicted small metal-binding protein
MFEFQCGHQECAGRLTASDKNYLMSQVAEHLKDVHNVQQATETLLTYLETTCVTQYSGSSAE